MGPDVYRSCWCCKLVLAGVYCCLRAFCASAFVGIYRTPQLLHVIRGIARISRGCSLTSEMSTRERHKIPWSANIESESSESTINLAICSSDSITTTSNSIGIEDFPFQHSNEIEAEDAFRSSSDTEQA
eukprot:IDg7833t1